MIRALMFEHLDPRWRTALGVKLNEAVGQVKFNVFQFFIRAANKNEMDPKII